MGESPFRGPNNRALFQDNSGTSIIDRIAGTLQKSDDNGVTFGPLGGSGSDWSSLMAAFLFTKSPSLTRAVAQHMGSSPNAPMSGNWVDGVLEGGAIRSGAAWALGSTASVFQTPKTGVIGVGYRARMSALGSGKGYLGIVNGAQTNHVTIRADSAISATFLNLIITAGGSSTTVTSSTVADHLMHDFVLVKSTAAAIDVYIDPVSLGVAAVPFATISNFANLIDEPMMPGWHFDSGASATDVSDCVYAFIAP